MCDDVLFVLPVRIMLRWYPCASYSWNVFSSSRMICFIFAWIETSFSCGWVNEVVVLLVAIIPFTSIASTVDVNVVTTICWVCLSML